MSLRRQHQTPLHDPNRYGYVNGEPRLFQPIPLQLQPGHGCLRRVLRLAPVIVDHTPGLDPANVTGWCCLRRIASSHDQGSAITWFI